MRKFFLVVLAVAASVSFAFAEVSNPDVVIQKVMKKTVILTIMEDEFCSGVVAQDPMGKTAVFTAAHCCVVYLRTGKAPTVVLSNNKTVEMQPLTEANLATNADACRMDFVPGNEVASNVKIASIGKDRELFGISAFPHYTLAERTNRLFVIGRQLENPYHFVASGQVFPGMSGSPVINMRGEVVGALVATYPRAPYPNLVMSVMDFTGFLGNGNPAPLPEGAEIGRKYVK